MGYDKLVIKHIGSIKMNIYIYIIERWNWIINAWNQYNMTELNVFYNQLWVHNNRLTTQLLILYATYSYAILLNNCVFSQYNLMHYAFTHPPLVKTLIVVFWARREKYAPPLISLKSYKNDERYSHQQAHGIFWAHTSYLNMDVRFWIDVLLVLK